MVSVQEASQIIQSVSIALNTTHIPVAESVGRVLAEEIKADRDLPPFNRVAMDGIAIQSDQFSKGLTLPIEDVQAAGAPQKILKDKTHCLEVMTGAVLPDGTDTVIRYEDVTIREGVAQIKLDAITPGMNIHKQGADAHKHDVLLKSGQIISPAEVAVMASVGKTSVSVFEFPSTAIISSGDELVDIGDSPLPHQVRRSNVYALLTSMASMGWKANAYHLADNKKEIEQQLGSLLSQYEVLILSGGVSKGKFDFIPDALTSLGVEKLFHQVSQRPGKPFWFGVNKNKRVVFALPGNPVSTFLCFYKYIQSWMYKQMGVTIQPAFARLASDVVFTPALTYFLQVSIRNEGSTLMANPAPGGGSGDFVNLKEVDGFIELPLNKSEFNAGESYPYIRFRAV